MNKELNDLKLITNDYKKILLPILLVVASFLIIFIVILPQISSISEKTRTISTQRGQVAVLKSSLSTVSNTPSTLVDADFTTSTRALPVQKDVSLIFDALTKAAAKSNTGLDSFTLTVGGIYGRAAAVPDSGASPVIEVSAHLSGATGDLVGFTKALEKSLPISEIKKISITDGNAVFEISFFYKSVNSRKIASQDDVRPLSQADKNILNKLRTWEE